MKMIKQRLMGLVLIAVSALVLAIASQGVTVEERDATAVLLTLPLGLYALFTKNYILCEGEPLEEDEEPQERIERSGNKRKEPYNGKETYYREPVPQVLGRRQRSTPGNRAGADRPR